jgi:hypothetical protein
MSSKKTMKQADIDQINESVRNGNINAARRLLEDSDDPRASKMLVKLNEKFPPPPMHPSVVSKPLSKPTSQFAPKPLPQITPAPAAKSSITKPKKELPTALRLNDDENDIEAIKLAIREKRYDDAEALLVLSDHPEADKLRDRLGAIRGPGSSGEKVKHVYVQADKDFTGRLGITVFLLIFLTFFGLIALAVWLPEAKRYPDAPGAGGLILANKIVTWTLRGILALILLFFALLVLSYLTRPGLR